MVGTIAEDTDATTVAPLALHEKGVTAANEQLSVAVAVNAAAKVALHAAPVLMVTGAGHTIVGGVTSLTVTNAVQVLVAAFPAASVTV